MKKTTKKRNLSQNPKLSSHSQPAEVKKLQTLTLEELDAISGAALTVNHNENIVSFSQLSQKQKPVPEEQATKVKELETLTIDELDAIAGAGVRMNHNETIIEFAK